MKELSNNMLFLHGVSERATDSLRQRKLQLKSDLRQERKNQSEQSEALKEEKESTLFAHLDETNRSKQEKLDKLDSDIDQVTKSIEEIKNVEKETGYGYTKIGGYANKMPGCLLQLLPVAVAIVVIAVGILTVCYIVNYDDMSYYRKWYEEKVEEKKEYDRFVLDHNAYEEHMREGQEHEKCNSTEEQDKAKLRYQSALEIEQRWKWNRKYYSQFREGASGAIERVDRKKEEIAEKAAAEKKRAEEQKRMFAAAKRLGSSANCYIVSSAGSYKFRTVKGNSRTSVGSVASAEVLWESFGTSTTPSVGDLVKLVSYKDSNIFFKTADTFKEGNAVIAAKDASGKILWSWHIWFTDPPQGQEYYNGAGTMLDRNLGATSATPGDVGALGLLYQWGRKDPFLGSSSISSNTVAQSTIPKTYTLSENSYTVSENSYPVSSNSSNGTIEYATAHPTTFITYNRKNYDWYYTGSSSTDNTRWTTSSSTKSIYDPCPAGWRVPDGDSNGVWSKALGSSSSYTGTYNSTNEGMNFSRKFGSASTIWYPASSFRNYYDGGLGGVGYYGYYWSASPNSGNSYYAYSLNFNYNGYVDPSYDYNRAYGFAVRCARE